MPRVRCHEPNYYLFEVDLAKIICLDEGALSEYINCDYAEDRQFPPNDVILREDGAICRIRPETIDAEMVELEDTAEFVSLDRVNELLQRSCAYLRLAPEPLRITDLSQLAASVNAICDRQEQLQRRFDFGCLAVVTLIGLAPLAAVVWKLWKS